ncbi:TetR/AcrR family transcriptional regulator [Thalassospira sp. TSL5-1]|uniref:TetR/AcrR family transcriptional regulator n=1 Tax=Thalassospira sp. TSL5-1 TaxID=1544451 RepID=UPI00093E89CF|nr:TetR/AcrR family transcriptional regulator [Thalassospira sp. TSL5-1]OKH89287.1 TetR family transcriptional regulator [Thalassospira sp. TSL5-1]
MSQASSPPQDRRSRKRLATRRTISQVADRLFRERGFENVTVDEIATAADVGRMTVFNHFPRKEDMFFDRDEEAREDLRDALNRCPPDFSPTEALRQLAHQLVGEGKPYVQFSARSQPFIEAIERSETLKARARTIRSELEHEVAAIMAAKVGRPVSDKDAHLAAGLLLAGWSVAFMAGHRAFREHNDSAKAAALFLQIIDQTAVGIKAALAGTPYVMPGATDS